MILIMEYQNNDTILVFLVSGFSKFNVKEEKYVDNYMQVNFIFIENKDHPQLRKMLAINGTKQKYYKNKPIDY